MSDHSPALSSTETTPDPATSTLSKVQPETQDSHGRKFLVWGGIGCVLLLCAGLLISSGAFFATRAFNDSSTNEVVLVEETDSTAEPESYETEAAAEIEGGDEPTTGDELDLEAAVSQETKQAPEIGSITFALDTTVQGEPLEPGFEFEAGLTRLYAVFDYANLSSDNIWTQVWYHNGSEVSSTSQPWLAEESGRYDYQIEAGGQPLPAGQWALEFYIDGDLLAAGSFVIEGETETAASGEQPDLDDIPKVYKLAYTKWNGEKHDLYVGDTNGDQERFILGRAAGPSWSRNGRYIFFYGEEGVDQQIINGAVYPLPGVTNGIIRLDAAPLPANASQAQMHQDVGWNDGTARYANVAPDGTMIAYDGDRGGGRRIYFLGTAANQQFRYEIIGEQADWSPDSQQIVYRSGRNNQTGIWISNRNDSGHRRITTGGTDSFPTWSFDGQTIAFSRDAGGNVDIYTVDVDGSNLQRLTDAPGHDTLPAFMPNGDLVFRTARSGRWSIWKMSDDGSDQTEIIANAPVGPDWAFSKMSVLR